MQAYHKTHLHFQQKQSSYKRALKKNPIIIDRFQRVLELQSYMPEHFAAREK